MKNWAGFQVDPLVVRGELLMEKRAAGTATPQELDELLSAELTIASRAKHLADFPLANDSAEESAQDLTEEQAQDRQACLVWLQSLARNYGELTLSLALRLLAK